MTEEISNEITDKALLRKTYWIVGLLLLNLLIWIIILILFTFLLTIIVEILRLIGINLQFESDFFDFLIFLATMSSTAILTMFLLLREGTEIISVVWKGKKL